MNPDSPFTVHGDETLEARIVAWVLGEASAFEEAELERLCEERPELLVFRHRMRALHGLLTEAEKQQPDEGWKLPEEKRKVLDEILGEKQGEVAQAMTPKQAGSSARRILLGLAACLLLSLIVLSFFGAGSASIQKSRKLMAMRESEKRVDFLPRETAPAAAMNDELAALEKDEAVGDRSPLDDFRARADSRFAKNEPESPAVGNLKRNATGGSGAAFSIPDAPADLGQIADGSVSSRDYALQPHPAASPAPAQMESDGIMASRSLEGTKERMVQLRPNFPPELIEGTPKPMILPPIIDTRAEGLAMNEPQNELRANPGQPAPANKPAAVSAPEGAAEVTSLSSVKDRLERKQAAAVAGAKNSEDLIAGKKSEAPAQPAKPASAPQPATATPATSDAEKDLAKLMSGGRVAGGENFFADSRFTGGGAGALGNTTESGGIGGGFIQEGFKSDAGAASADGTFGFSTRRTASDEVWGSNFSNDANDKETDGDVDRYADASQMPSLSMADQTPADGQAATDGNRSGDFAKNKNSIDAILADPYGRTSVVAKPIRTNAAEAPGQAQSADAVRKNLYMAEGNYNLGKYDDAKKSYEDVLRADPYNAAARRGMERLAQAKSDYYRAAYDHTRAELLSQVDSTWEIAVPEDPSKAEASTVTQATPSEPKAQDEELKADEFWDTAKTAKEPSRTEFEIQTDKTTEYAFRGKDLSEEKQQAAKPDLSKLIEEVAASEEPYSTFSLNISDASFQIAQAAMAKGERPDPAGVKVEQFYNAVDYGDPAPAAGEPVAVNIEQSAHPVIPGRNLVRVALKTSAAGRAASQPLHLTLLVDQSGSMSREDRRTAMKQALNSLGGLLSNNDRVTVIGFSRTPHLLADAMPGDKSKNLADLVNLEASEGGTNLEEAMKLGGQLAERQKQAGAQNRIVLFTDGAANLGDADPEKLAEHVKQLRQKGIAFDIAGIAAADLNDGLLAELARNGNGRYYVVGKGDDENFAKQLAGAFRPAAENVKVQVHFNPERVARYKLIGFEKDRLKTEDFRNDAVDAAEMAAEEAGVAIYQIEPIADGKGEIGEVSVRFRDTTAGQMVERTWAISNDPSTPAFDRATPSMQLATFAMLAAEKLKGGAYAEAIDFKQLSAPQANVKHFYGDQGRPAEVLRMVEALK